MYLALTFLHPLLLFVRWKMQFPALLALQLALVGALWLLWHFSLKPLVARRGKDETDGKLLCGNLSACYAAWIYAVVDCLLPYLLCSEPMSSLDLLLMLGAGLLVYVELFLTTAPNRLLALPDGSIVKWGRFLPASGAFVLFAALGGGALRKEIALALLFLAFTLECVAAMIYNGKKYGKAVHICPDNPIE